MDSFEKKLKSQAFRQPPLDLKRQIFAGSKIESNALQSEKESTPCGVRPFNWLTGWMWPHPAAWAGLAALWVVLVGFNYSVHPPQVDVEVRQIDPRQLQDMQQYRAVLLQEELPEPAKDSPPRGGLINSESALG